MHAALLNGVLFAEKYEEFVRVLIGQGEVNEMLDEATEFIEYQILIGFELHLLLLFLGLEHVLELAEALLEESLVVLVLVEMHLREISPLLPPGCILHFETYCEFYAVFPVLCVLPYPMVCQYR